MLMTWQLTSLFPPKKKSCIMVCSAFIPLQLFQLKCFFNSTQDSLHVSQLPAVGSTQRKCMYSSIDLEVLLFPFYADFYVDFATIQRGK